MLYPTRLFGAHWYIYKIVESILFCSNIGLQFLFQKGLFWNVWENWTLQKSSILFAFVFYCQLTGFSTEAICKIFISTLLKNRLQVAWKTRPAVQLNWISQERRRISWKGQIFIIWVICLYCLGYNIGISTFCIIQCNVPSVLWNYFYW